MFSRDKLINQNNGSVNNSEVFKLAHAIAKSYKRHYGSKYTYTNLFRDALNDLYKNVVPNYKLKWNIENGQMIKTSDYHGTIASAKDAAKGGIW